MSPVVGKRLLTVEAEFFHHRKVVEGKQAGVLAFRAVSVFVPNPCGNAENILFLPVETLAADDRKAAALAAAALVTEEEMTEEWFDENVYG